MENYWVSVHFIDLMPSLRQKSSCPFGESPANHPHGGGIFAPGMAEGRGGLADVQERGSVDFNEMWERRCVFFVSRVCTADCFVNTSSVDLK